MGLYLGKEKISNVASAITQSADSMATEIQNHIADTDIHITADERTKWNAAAENTDNFASTGLMDATVGIDMNSGTIKRCWGINLMDISGNNMNISYDDEDPEYSIKLHATSQQSRDIRLTGLATPTQDTDATNKAYVDSKALPTTSTSDNGKVLSVVNGAWAAAAMSSGAYVGSYTGTDANITLSFDFKPAAIFIVKYINSLSYSYSYIAINGFDKLLNIRYTAAQVSGGDTPVTWGDKSITITHQVSAGVEDPTANGDTFYYIAIPAMN